MLNHPIAACLIHEKAGERGATFEVHRQIDYLELPRCPSSGSFRRLELSVEPLECSNTSAAAQTVCRPPMTSLTQALTAAWARQSHAERPD